MLLRIPGIGPKIANSILEARIKGKLSQPEELSFFGVNLIRAAPFILVNGKYLAHQTSFL
jgi:predicted DNA-binding helix-hairpin-helix protein